MSIGRWYAGAVVRLRWLIVAGWVGAAVAAAMFMPTLEQTGGGGRFGGLVEADNPAIRTEIRSLEKFRLPVLTRTAVVQRNRDGLPASTQLEAISAALDFNVNKPPELGRIELALPVTNSLGLVPGSREQDTTAITYLFFRPEASFRTQTNLAEGYARRYASEPDDHLVGVTGVIPGRVAQLEAIRSRLATVEIVTIVLIFLVVAVNFRSVGAPLVTMATAALAFTMIVRTAGWLGGEAGFDVPSEIEPVLVALLLGIVTDYSIFFLSGMRERLGVGDDRLAAARRAADEFGPIVVVAGLTVAAGSMALLVAEVGAFRSFGPGMALTILISLAVAVTFVPACLAVFGGAVFWPWSPRSRVLGATSEASSDSPLPNRGSRLVEVITAKRGALAVVAVGCVALLLIAAPVHKLNLGFSVIESLPESNEVARAADAAGKGFSPGIVSPIVLLVEAPGVSERRAALSRLEEVIERQPGIAGVVGPREQPTPASLGAVLSEDGDAARYVLFSSAKPLSGTAINHFAELRDHMPQLLAAAGVADADYSFAGDTAAAHAIVSQTESDLGMVLVVAAVLGFLLLVLFLRALVAPLYLMAANLLALAAALGVTTFIFQTRIGQGGITFYVPFAAAVLLVALGSDYSIFGVGYIWSEARHRPLVEAIKVAVPRSTRAISAAGITLALSFAALALVPLAPFREFALAMSAGILIDVFVVRSLLVPSLVSLVGPVSGWPGRFLRRAADASAPEADVDRPRVPLTRGPGVVVPQAVGSETLPARRESRAEASGGLPDRSQAAWLMALAASVAALWAIASYRRRHSRQRMAVSEYKASGFRRLCTPEGRRQRAGQEVSNS